MRSSPAAGGTDVPTPYSYTPHLRFTLPAGPSGGQVDYDLSTWRFVTICQPLYTPELVEHVLINRSRDRVKYGRYLDVNLEILVDPGSTEDANIAAIAALTDRDDVTEEISLNGTDYRAGYIAHLVPTALQGKNVALVYSLLFKCRDLIVGVPLAGAWPAVVAGVP